MKQLGCLALLLCAGLGQAEQSLSAAEILRQMADASRSLDYRGRLLHIRGEQINTLELLHARLAGEENERLTQLAGERAEVIRRGNEIICVHADRSITRLPGSKTSNPLSLYRQLSDTVPDQYQLTLEGVDRVAGLDVDALRVEPRDGFRFGYRLWIDRDSRLLIRSELINNAGKVLERIEFVSLQVGAGLDEADFALPSSSAERALDSLQVSANQGTMPALQIGWVPEGFREVDRDLRLTGVDRVPVSALTFTDGLASFTLFVEPGNARVLPLSESWGATRAASRELFGPQGNYRLTLLGEVPAVTVERVLAHASLAGAEGVDR